LLQAVALDRLHRAVVLDGDGRLLDHRIEEI
jgi:hypothetical protein